MGSRNGVKPEGITSRSDWMRGGCRFGRIRKNNPQECGVAWAARKQPPRQIDAEDEDNRQGHQESKGWL